MCLICIEFQKERMTILEARRALGEMIEKLDETHVEAVIDMLDEAEQRDGSGQPPAAGQG